MPIISFTNYIGEGKTAISTKRIQADEQHEFENGRPYEYIWVRQWAGGGGLRHLPLLDFGEK
jgi:hypothetical protein